MLNLLLRFLALVASFEAAMCSDSVITIPLEDGSLVIQDAHLRMDYDAIVAPELSFTLHNRTSYPWTKLKLQFEIDANCGGEQRHWSRAVDTFLGWMGDPAVQSINLSEEGKRKVSLSDRAYSGLLVFPQGKVDGCGPATIQATLLLAENSKVRIGITGDRRDLEKERADEAASKLERDRIAAAEQAKKDAAGAARQRRLAAERQKKQADEDARYAKGKAEQDAREAEERRRIRAACSVLYQKTADKRIGDLTVREEQQVRACQVLGLYPPY